MLEAAAAADDELQEVQAVDVLAVSSQERWSELVWLVVPFCR